MLQGQSWILLCAGGHLSWPEIHRFMDACEAVGMGVIYAPDGARDLQLAGAHNQPDVETAVGWLRGNISMVKMHPALMAYYICKHYLFFLPIHCAAHGLTLPHTI